VIGIGAVVGQELADELLALFGGRIGEKLIELLGRGEKANAVEIGAAGEDVIGDNSGLIDLPLLEIAAKGCGRGDEIGAIRKRSPREGRDWRARVF